MQLTRHFILILTISAFVSPLAAMEKLQEETLKLVERTNEERLNIEDLLVRVKQMAARVEVLENVLKNSSSSSSEEKNKNNHKQRKVQFDNNLSNTNEKKLNKEDLEEQKKLARRNIKIVAGTALFLGITIGVVATKYYVNSSKSK
jgi:hypothetical protein